jgi:hypothetical protein
MWKMFHDISTDSRESFFDVEEDDATHACKIDARIDVKESFFSKIRKYIVEKVIRELFLDPSQDGRVETAMSVFKKDDDKSGNMEHKVTVRKEVAFVLAIDYIRAGLSFRQAMTVLSSPAQRTGFHTLRVIHEADVARFVHAVIGINLQIQSDFLIIILC